MTLPEDFVERLNAHGYLAVQRIDDEHWCAISPNFLFTTAVVRGNAIDIDFGYERRWCYHDLVDATVALAEWKERGFADKPLNYITEK